MQLYCCRKVRVRHLWSINSYIYHQLIYLSFTFGLYKPTIRFAWSLKSAVFEWFSMEYHRVEKLLLYRIAKYAWFRTWIFGFQYNYLYGSRPRIEWTSYNYSYYEYFSDSILNYYRFTVSYLFIYWQTCW